ncbi:hypothetical protein V8F33_004806 [Rhypophila sp. PSN 637]
MRGSGIWVCFKEFSLYPRNSVLDPPKSGSRGSHHSYFPTPSISPTATASDIANTPTTSEPSTYSAYGLDYDSPQQNLGQWTEGNHGVDLHPAVACPGSESGPPFFKALAPASLPKSAHHNFDHSHLKCGQQLFSGQNIQASQLWPQGVPSYPPQPENLAAVFRYHSSPLIANYFDPLIGLSYDSAGLSDQDARQDTKCKMETLRKRRHNASTESSTDQRQTKPRLTEGSGRKGTGIPRTNTRSANATSETNWISEKGRKDTAVTIGANEMLSPTSPFMHSDTHDDTEESPQDGITYSGEEGSVNIEGGGGRDKARLKHNKVERKYRNRLNTHFEQLLGVLPPAGASKANSQPMAPPTLSNTSTTRKPHEHKASSRRDRERKVSKSEVLDRARMYIQSLENQHERLLAERKELLQVWEEYGRSVQGGLPTR